MWSRTVTGITSTSLRVLAYIFLRWIPGDFFPSAIAALTAIYVTSFVLTFIYTDPFKVVSDTVDVIARPVDDEEEDELIAEGVVPVDAGPIEELDVQETVVLEEKSPSIFESLLLGTPSPTSFLWTTVAFLSNLALIAMVYDLTYRAAVFYPAHDLSFSRLGYVSHNSAKVLVREPDHMKVPIFLSFRYADTPLAHHSSTYDSTWKHAATVQSLSSETDFTATLTISQLSPDTRYQYVLSNNHSGFLVTAPKPGHISERRSSEGTFTFLHTSCVIPHFPYNLADHALSIPGFRHLSTVLKSIKPAFMLFLGDFIYIDVPRRHGTDIATYRKHYRQVYASPDWPSVSRTGPLTLDSYSDHSLPWIHMYDDHEIANDWSSNTSGVFPSALDPYTHYHASLNPASAPNTSYFSFTHGPATFFMLDTRRHRTPPNSPSPSMLGPTQRAALIHWLLAPVPSGVRWKIILSSVPFTTNWRINTADTWGGYVAERSALLAIMHSVPSAPRTRGTRIVILSGDRHEFAATRFPGPSDLASDADVYEFSASPAGMFYSPVRSYVEKEGEECVMYIPEGNSKVGVVSVERETGSGVSVLRYKLFVDGEETWSHVLMTRATGLGRGGAGEGLWG